ncbi:MAG: 3-deoxy-manno-octulosonate cytidylyltransferase [Candidatus Marinimicrobia bacterium]|nr:3-deoxy-manno-octulosonate cytidylyltransferase [Candidatus Neomarinimicrobiota bacterium]
MNVLGVIPARYNSTRLPGKPLKVLNGKSLIQRVYENALKSKLINELVVATDDERIFKHVKSFGGKSVLTPSYLPSGTDRAAYVAKLYGCDIIANVQGDEPFLSCEVIDDCIKALIDNDNLLVSTAAHSGIREAELADPNTVKVLVNRTSEAIYFSRQDIPYIRLNGILIADHPALIHIGIYVYRKDFLLRFIGMPVSKLERLEQLEQLRILENGYKIKVIITDKDSFGIDTPEDLGKAENILQKNSD